MREETNTSDYPLTRNEKNTERRFQPTATFKGWS